MSSFWIVAGGLGASSLFGSLLGMFFRKIPHKWNDTFLGFCAGMMLGASIVCLLMPAVKMSLPGGWWQVIVGVILGVLLISALDYFTPHLHHITGTDTEEHHNNKSHNRILLFVLAIAIHKFPEGMATGIVFDEANLANTYTVALTIALQNIPEGMVVVTPLILIGARFGRILLISLSIAILEMLGVAVGVALGDISAMLLPTLTALAGGAMLYVISDEMIPETHSHGYEKNATCALVAGVLLMLFIEQIFV
jgi:zinc transporter, ZIP family